MQGLNKEITDLEKSAQMRGSLNTLRSIGHDILNPVSRMKRILGVLKTQPTYEESALVTNLESNLKRLSGYAEQIKSLYKRETGDLIPTTPLTDLSLEIRNLAGDLRGDNDALTKNIHIDLTLTDNCLVQAPPSILSRIAENLIVNSIHASPSNSTVKVSVEKFRESVVLRVSDNGTGISETIKDKIFDASFTTKTNKGTGLGLFIVKQLCEEQGALINCFSKIGEGTIFEIYFPDKRALS